MEVYLYIIFNVVEDVMMLWYVQIVGDIENWYKFLYIYLVMYFKNQIYVNFFIILFINLIFGNYFKEMFFFFK